MDRRWSDTRDSPGNRHRQSAHAGLDEPGIINAVSRAIYWSRSRNKLWRKGEDSGHVQLIKDIRLDCDNDVLLLEVEQLGGIACHTGRHNCFYKQLQNEEWVAVEPVIKNPDDIYKK